MTIAAARASILHMLPAHLERSGFYPSDVFPQVGISLAAIGDSAVVHRAQLHSALSLAAKLTGKSEIALALGSAADSARLGPAGLALTAGATLEQCLNGHIALLPRLQARVKMTLETEGSVAILGHQLIGDGQAAWLLYAGAAAYHVKQLRSFIGNDWSPSLVTFPHPCRGRLRTYRDFFNCEVLFEAGPASRIHFPREELFAPRPATSPRIHYSRDDLAPIGTFCLQHLERFAADGPWVLETIECMAHAGLPHQSLTLSTAASRIGLSQRTIQRRLSDLECTFEDIVDGVRQKIALERLTNSDQSITAVAMSLGYSDTAHFNRAFRRWTGRSPSDFRSTASPSAGSNAPPARPKT